MSKTLSDWDAGSLVQELKAYWIQYVDRYCAEHDGEIVPEISDAILENCIEHLRLTIEANKVMNLTRITEPHDAVILHLLDSLALLPFIQKAPDGTLLDIGTGAGFPGLTLALASGRPSLLMDSVGKKVQAVNSFIEALGIESSSAVKERAEAFAVDHRAACSVVVARAVAPLSVLIEYATPLLCKQGHLVVTKGTPSSEEFQNAAYTAELCGLYPEEVYRFQLPCDKGERSIIVYRKTARSRVKLPRAVGMAKNRPLVS